MIVCMASGNGSNFEAIVNAGVKIDLLVTNNPKARVIDRALNLQVPYVVSKEEYEFCIPKSTKLVILAGFMKILSKEFVDEFSIVNTHPSLLPSFRGMHAIRQSFEAGVKITGLTIHWVDQGVDTGPIIAQVPCRIFPKDTEDTIRQKIKKLEHVAYPEAIKGLLNE